MRDKRTPEDVCGEAILLAGFAILGTTEPDFYRGSATGIPRKKINALRVALKIFIYWPKKIDATEMLRKKKFWGLENSPPPARHVPTALGTLSALLRIWSTISHFQHS